jgi:hypothetical protein
MDHAAGHDGPSQLTVLKHDYVTDARSQASCNGLSFAGPTVAQ